jgi:hypothetical protein
MMQKSATFTTILHVKKCHFHYNMQKNLRNRFFLHIVMKVALFYMQNRSESSTFVH